MSANHTAETTSTRATVVTTSGPLGPWRLSAAVLAVAVTSGPQLVTATSTGNGLDQALGRSLGVATVTWVLLGVINRILAGTTVVDDATSPATDDTP